MSLVTPNSVLEYTIIDDADHARTVALQGPAAEARMREVLTAGAEAVWETGPVEGDAGFHDYDQGDVYQSIVDGDSPWVAADKTRLKRAETVYAFADSLTHLNIDIATDGQLVQATGFEQSRTRYRTESSVAEAERQIKNGAIRMAKELLTRHDRDDPRPVYIL